MGGGIKVVRRNLSVFFTDMLLFVRLLIVQVRVAPGGIISMPSDFGNIYMDDRKEATTQENK